MSNFNIEEIRDRLDELDFSSTYYNKLIKLLNKKYGEIVDVFLTLISYIENYKSKGYENENIYVRILKYIDDSETYKDFIFIDENVYKDLIAFHEKEKNIYKGTGIQLKGVFKCKTCGDNNIFISIKFTRSYDEPATIILTCSKGHTWRDS